MSSAIRLLIVEDSDDDALLIANEMTNAGYEVSYQRIETREALEDALTVCDWDVILIDYKLPGFSGIEALETVRNAGMYCPCIIVSGVIDEETAVSAMRAGAQDYVLKGNLARLVPAIERELREAEVRKQREEARRALDEEHRRLEALLEALPVGVFVTDAEGRVVDTNEQTAKIWHGEPPAAGEIKDYSRYPGWWPDTGKMLKAEEWGLARALLRGEVSVAEVINIRRLDGTEGTILNSAAPIRGADGTIIGAIATNQDITELVNLRDELVRSRDELQEALDRERHYSYLLQRALLPKAPSLGEGYDVAAEYVPAHADRGIGGDFYDVFELRGRHAGILIGDVSGKGLEAAAMAATTRSTVHAFVHGVHSPGLALGRANNVICSDQTDPGAFVTVYLVIIDTATGSVSYAGAGHPPPFIRRADASIDELEIGEPPLGVSEGQQYRDLSSHLQAGDKLVLYTDGVSEARHAGRLLGTAGVKRVIERHADQSAKRLALCLIEAATKWCGGKLQDDAAVVVIERTPQA